jgi:hypothetical protein
MFQFNRRRMLTLTGAAATLAPFTLSKSAAAAPVPVPTGSTGPMVLLDPPVRLLDSRGILSGGVPTKIKSGERLAFGFLGTEDFGIAGAFINLTVTQTKGAGFLTVQAFQGPTSPPGRVLTSNINWTSDGQTIANSSLVPVGFEGLAELICTGGETHFIIDVQGYLPSLAPAP